MGRRAYTGFRGPALNGAGGNAGGRGNGFLSAILGGSRGTGNGFLGPLLGGTGVPDRPVPGMFWWGISDVGVIPDGGAPTEVAAWIDQSPAGSIVINGAMARPFIEANVLNGRQGIRFSELIEGRRFLDGTAPFVINGNDPLTVYTVCIPRNNDGGALFTCNGAGDSVPPCRSSIMFESAGTQYGYTAFTGAPFDAAFAVNIDYTGVPIIAAHYYDPLNVWCSVGGVDRPLVPNAYDTSAAIRTKFWVGGMWMTGGLFQRGFDGWILEQIAYLSDLRGTPDDVQNYNYLANAWGL